MIHYQIKLVQSPELHFSRLFLTHVTSSAAWINLQAVKCHGKIKDSREAAIDGADIGIGVFFTGSRIDCSHDHVLPGTDHHGINFINRKSTEVREAAIYQLHCPGFPGYLHERDAQRLPGRVRPWRQRHIAAAAILQEEFTLKSLGVSLFIKPFFFLFSAFYPSNQYTRRQRTIS